MLGSIALAFMDDVNQLHDTAGEASETLYELEDLLQYFHFNSALGDALNHGQSQQVTLPQRSCPDLLGSVFSRTRIL